jgi:hypothetical protein
MLPLVIGESFVFYSIISLSHHFQLLRLDAVRHILRVEHLEHHFEIEHILPNGSCELMPIAEPSEEHSLGLQCPGNGQQIVILTEQPMHAPSSCAVTTSIPRRRTLAMMAALTRTSMYSRSISLPAAPAQP